MELFLVEQLGCVELCDADLVAAEKYKDDENAGSVEIVHVHQDLVVHLWMRNPESSGHFDQRFQRKVQIAFNDLEFEDLIRVVFLCLLV